MNENEIMKLIMKGGNARSLAMEAIQKASTGEFLDAEALIKESDSELIEAHHTQTTLLHNEAAGKNPNISLLMVHAQDHLMNAMTIRDLAEEIINLYKKMEV